MNLKYSRRRLWVVLICAFVLIPFVPGYYRQQTLFFETDFIALGWWLIFPVICLLFYVWFFRRMKTRSVAPRKFRHWLVMIAGVPVLVASMSMLAMIHLDLAMRWFNTQTRYIDVDVLDVRADIATAKSYPYWQCSRRAYVRYAAAEYNFCLDHLAITITETPIPRTPQMSRWGMARLSLREGPMGAVVVAVQVI